MLCEHILRWLLRTCFGLCNQRRRTRPIESSKTTARKCNLGEWTSQNFYANDIRDKEPPPLLVLDIKQVDNGPLVPIAGWHILAEYSRFAE